MSVKKRFISLFFSLCIVGAFIFQSAHLYSHLLSEHFGVETSFSHNEKATHHQHADDCKICHFNISPFNAVSFDTFIFFTSIAYEKAAIRHHSNYVAFSFNGYSLRAPPIYTS